MARCYFCPRTSSDTLHDVYEVCEFCKKAFEEGFKTGRVYESERRRLNPRKVKKGLQ